MADLNIDVYEDVGVFEQIFYQDIILDPVFIFVDTYDTITVAEDVDVGGDVDLVGGTLPFYRIKTEYITISEDVTVVIADHVVSVSDSISISESFDYFYPELSIDIYDSLALSDVGSAGSFTKGHLSITANEKKIYVKTGPPPASEEYVGGA